MNHVNESKSENLNSNISLFAYDLSSKSKPNSSSCDLRLSPTFFLLEEDISLDSDDYSPYSEEAAELDNSPFSSIVLGETTREKVGACQKCIERGFSNLRDSPPKLSRDSIGSAKHHRNNEIKDIKNIKNDQMKQTLDLSHVNSNDKPDEQQKNDCVNPIPVPCKKNTQIKSSDSPKADIESCFSQDAMVVEESNKETGSTNIINANKSSASESVNSHCELNEEKQFVQEEKLVIYDLKEEKVYDNTEKHKSPPHTSDYSKKGDAIGNPSKKKCIFPVKRTKAKPLPILDDELLPNRKPPSLSSNTSTKYRGRTTTNKNLFLRDCPNIVEYHSATARKSGEFHSSDKESGISNQSERTYYTKNNTTGHEQNHTHHWGGRPGNLPYEYNSTPVRQSVMDTRPIASVRTEVRSKESEEFAMDSNRFCPLIKPQPQLQSSSSSSSNIDPKHVMNLLELINVNKYFLGCIGETLHSLMIEANHHAMEIEPLLIFLGDCSNVSLLRACYEILSSFNKETVTEVQIQSIQMSVKALDKIFSLLKQFSSSSKSFDVQKLAIATFHMSNSEIRKFLKTFLEFKGCEILEPNEFEGLCQKVVDCQLEMTLNNKRSSSQSNSLRANIEDMLFSSSLNGKIVQNRPVDFASRVNSKGESSTSYQNESPVVNSSRPRNNNIDARNNYNASTAYGPQLILKRDDLEKLVENFFYLENEPRQAILDYIKCLEKEDPQYAAFLFKRIYRQT